MTHDPVDAPADGVPVARPSGEHAEGPAERSGELPVAPASLGEVGGYELRERLGSGGMGTVYSAVDGDGVEVALKRIHPHVAEDPRERERLAREVTLLHRVRHQGVARVLDAEIEGQEAFLVTELVDGPTLEADVHTHGPFAADELSGLAHGLGDALEAIHAQGIVHRDLKPSNVMLAPRGPVLIDFGIAQVVDDARLTQTGMVTGTPGYVDPELIAGAEPGREHDWWAWAAVLLFAASGHAPFGSGTLATVLARVTAGSVDVSGAPPLVGRALAAALHPDPAARLSPADVLQVIDGYWGEQELENATRAMPVDRRGSTAVPAWGAATMVHDGASADAGHGDDPYGRSVGGHDRGDLPTSVVGPDEVGLDDPDLDEGDDDVALPPSYVPSGRGTGGGRGAWGAELRPAPVSPVVGAGPGDGRGIPVDPRGATPGWAAPGRQVQERSAHGSTPWGASGAAAPAPWVPGTGGHPGHLARPPWAPPEWAREPARRPGLVALLGAGLSACGAVRPGVAAVAVTVLLLALGALGWNSRARRESWRRHGPRSGDAARAVLRLPWDLALSALSLLLGLVLGALAALLAYYVGEGVFAASPHLREWTAWLAFAVGLLTCWVVPTSAPQRRGARDVLARIGGGGRTACVVLAVAGAGAALAWVLAGGVVVWDPVQEPPSLGSFAVAAPAVPAGLDALMPARP